MGSTTPLLDVLSVHLPAAISHDSAQFKSTLETFLAFALGADCPPRLSSETRQQWSRAQPAALKALQDYLAAIGKVGSSSSKRSRDSQGDTEGNGDPSAKRAKTDDRDDNDAADDPPRFTLPSVSATSPVRKKVDVTVHACSIRFVNPTTRALESSIPLAGIARAFLLPTRGKTRDHWTVVVLPAGAYGEKEKQPGKPSSAQQQQIIFGIDARCAASFETTSYHASENAAASATTATTTTTTTTVAKGQETAPSVRQLLSHLPVPLLEPSATVFRSSCATAATSGAGAAGVDAYLSAKAGTLWFLDAGILWGESKPCAFWSVEDLCAKNGVRTLSATGRTCSVILSRKAPKQKGGDDDDKDDDEDEDEDEDEDDEVIETEFSMVDGREQDPIAAWTRNRKHLFEKKVGSSSSPSYGGGAATTGANQSRTASSSGAGAPARTRTQFPQFPTSGGGATTIKGELWDDSDPDDNDFETDSSEDLDGSSSASDSDAGLGSGSDPGEGEGVGDSEDDDDDDAEGSGEEEELTDRQKAAVDMVVQMLRGDSDEELSNEEDELED